MGLFEAIIRALIAIGLAVLIFFIVLWALAGFGIVIPPNIVHVIQIIGGLIVILILARLFYPWLQGSWFGGPRDGPGPDGSRRY
jgi:hypothetical protein